MPNTRFTGGVMGQRDRTAAVAAGFDRSWSLIRESRNWWPAAAEVECARLHREAGTSEAALESSAYVAALGASLRKWKAFRGARFDAERFTASLREVAPLLLKWEGTTILTLRPADAADLFDLFEALRDIKPTERKWVATSKTLYHLLPDLILPMDNLVTAPFLGRSSLPAAFERAFLVEAYEAFIDVARDRDVGIGAKRVKVAAQDVPYVVEGAQPQDCRIGLARVIDFAIAGLVPDHASRAILRAL
jgi:hypothetical protein